MSTAQDAATHDRQLIALGGAATFVSVALAIAEALHLLPSGLAVLLIIAATSFALRVLFRLRARRSSALSNPRVMNIVTLVLLGVSLFAAITDILTALQSNGWVHLGDFWPDLGWHLWSLLIVLVIAIPARTMGWRSILGVLLVGLLGVSSLSLLVGSPVVSALGSFDDRAVALWVPFTEELLKALPVALFALLALRNRRRRPAALDFGVLGFASGTGFALIENVDFGRVDGSWDAALPLSAFFPSMFTQGVGDQLQVVAGHAVWSGLIGLAIGFGVLYSRRWRFAWIAIPVAFAVSFAEHAFTNASEPPVFAVELTVDGMLSSLLFLTGMIALACFEHRPWSGPRSLVAGVLVHPTELADHRAALAIRQRATRTTAPSTVPTTGTTGEVR